MSASRESSLLSDDDVDSDDEEEEEYEDVNVNPIARLRKLNNIEDSASSSINHSIPAAAHVSKRPSNASSSAISSIDDSKQQQHSSDSSSSSSQQHQKALLSLLKDMRSLEQQMESQKQSYINEKATLTNTVSQQATYISELQQTNEELHKQNQILNKQLSTMLSKLDRFATGCWKFQSSSVKKMSSALHNQLREWNKLYQQQVVVNANVTEDKTNNSNNMTTALSVTCSQEEEEAMELVTMEKLMNMELEIQELKKMNCDLKEKLSQRSDRKKKTKKKNKMEDGDESIFSGIDDTPTKLLTKENAKKVQVSKDSPVRSILKQSSRYDHRLNTHTLKVRLQHSPKHSLQCKPKLNNAVNNLNDRVESYMESDMWAVSWGDEEKSEV